MKQKAAPATFALARCLECEDKQAHQPSPRFREHVHLEINITVPYQTCIPPLRWRNMEGSGVLDLADNGGPTAVGDWVPVFLCAMLTDVRNHIEQPCERCGH